MELVEGRLWAELRALALAGDGLPAAWNRGAHRDDSAAFGRLVAP